MEKSTRPSYEQGERGTTAQLVSISVGFSLFWLIFFLAVLYDPFAQLQSGETGTFWHGPLPAAVVIGLALADVIIFFWCDRFATEEGHKTLRYFGCAFSVFPTGVLLVCSLSSVNVFTPVAVAAWFVAGLGLGCLLALWSEFLVCFAKAFASKVIVISAMLGAALYFCATYLSTAVEALVPLLAAPASLLLLKLLEQDVASVAYVSRAESLERHRLTKPIDALNTLYGCVFGLAICTLLLQPPSFHLYAGIAFAIMCGAALMLPYLEKNADKMMHGKVQRLIFPFLVLGLLPIPFVDTSLRLLCMLVILAAYLCLTLVNLDSLLCLVKRYRVAPFYLVGRGHAPIVVGVGIGYLAGYAAAYVGVESDDLFAFISLGLVVLLTIFVTVINFDKDQLESERAEKPLPPMPPGQPQPTRATWRERCNKIAKESNLSAREIEVFNLLAKGRGSVYIQEKLCISQHTVKTHTYHIYKKLGINSREELLTLIEQTRLEDPENTKRVPN